MIGELLALFSAFAFASASVAVAKADPAASGEGGVLLSVLLTGLLSALAWLVAGLPLETAAAAPDFTIAWFVASGVLATVWGRQTLYKAVQNAGVIRATTVRRLTPFFSALLGWLILNEAIGGLTGVGLGLLALSFALLVFDRRDKFQADAAGANAPPDIPRGYMFGVLCAAFYAVSYIARKFGLMALPDAYLGAFIGSMAALGYYVVGCCFSRHYRSVVAAALRRPDPWYFVAALCISTGQISQFIALTYTGVTQVAVINSVEIYIGAYLAVVIFKTERRPSAGVLFATLLATAGVVMVAVG
ncbi:MAG: EamA family transporter [Hyphomicrobiales bacterium]|nr:EamA family transporter [Hyphomicrobiales bacterium]